MALTAGPSAEADAMVVYPRTPWPLLELANNQAPIAVPGLAGIIIEKLALNLALFRGMTALSFAWLYEDEDTRSNGLTIPNTENYTEMVLG